MPSKIEILDLLSGACSGGKRSVYEPNHLQRCQQLVCTKSRAVLIVLGLVLLSLIFALIAAFARPSCVDLTTPSPIQQLTTTAPLSTSGEPFPWRSIALPDTVAPESYDLQLNVDLDQESFDYTGKIAMRIFVKKDTDFIVFHSKNLTIEEGYTLVEIDDDTELKEIPIEKMLETTSNEQIYMKLGQTLKALKRYQLKLEFQGELSNGLVGFYRSSYTLPDGSKRWVEAPCEH
jgi:hypothetical protein